MQNKSGALNELYFVQALNRLVSAYEEIYTIKMQKVRDAVLHNRKYSEGLLDVFNMLKISYQGQIYKVLNSDKANSLTKKNGKSLSILVSSNKRFSGDINLRVFNQFYDYIKKNPCDILIMGKIGRDLYAEKGRIRAFSYIEIPNDNPENIDFAALNSLANSYQTVFVFYGKFINLMNQAESFANVTADQIKYRSNITDTVPSAGSLFLFEPSIENTLYVFETQILNSLIRHMVQESHLAELGSRVYTMEQAVQNVQYKLGRLNFITRKLKKEYKNKKMLQSFSSMSFWHN